MRTIIEYLENGKVVVKCDCGSVNTLTTKSHFKATSRCRKCTGPENAKLTYSDYVRPHLGIGDISLKVFRYLRKTAKDRSIPFELDLQYLWDLFIQQDRECVYTAVPLKFPLKSTKAGDVDHRAMTASLDRIDSSKGYVKGNVQWVHKIVNRMKGTLSDSEFKNWCKLVATHC